jgi:hypothetical protein
MEKIPWERVHFNGVTEAVNITQSETSSRNPATSWVDLSKSIVLPRRLGSIKALI